MNTNCDFCPDCGAPMSEHTLVLLVPKVVFNAITGLFERQWVHGNANPSLN